MSSIASGTTTTTALVQTADTSGVLQLQTNGTTTAVTIDTAQRVGIGTSSPTTKLVIGGSTGNYGLQIAARTDFSSISGQLLMTDNTGSACMYTASGALIFATGATVGTNGGTEQMRLDTSGNLLVGNTTAYAKFQVYQASNAYAGFIYQQYATSSSTSNAAMQVRNDYVTGSNTGYMIVFQNGNATYSGSITSTTTATAYNTTSDRRLKTNIVDLTNSGTVIDSLKPRSFTWISDSSADAGFIADEFQQVLPKAVTGQPNATKEEEYEVTPAVKDSMGNITTPAVMGTRTVPVYQMIDASQPELIAYLVAEVQSLRARLKAANIA